MRVLVTGGNGFLGSHICDELARRGHELRLLLRSTSSTRFLDGLVYERAEGDIRSETAVARACAGVDAVVHCAGLTSALRAAEYDAVNGQGSAIVASAAASAGVSRFVYVSSLAVRGSAAPDADLPSPLSAYGRSKLAGEVATLAHAHEMSVAIVRPPVIYGPRDRGLLPFFRLVKLGVMPLYGDGSNRISWIHAYDAATATAAAVTAGPPGGVYSIDDGGPHSWRELTQLLTRAMGRRRMLMLPVPGTIYTTAGHAAGFATRLSGRRLPLGPDKAREMAHPFWFADTSRITADLGWKPRIAAAEGVSMTLDWYREQRWL